MTSNTFLQNIDAQPDALRRVVDVYGSQGGRTLLGGAHDLLRGKVVHSSGMGASLFALQATRRLLDAAVPGHLIEETGYLSENLSDLSRPLEALLLVSQSGETVEARELQGMRPSSVPTVAITRNLDSSVATAADLVLPMACEGDLSVAVQTYSSTVAVLALLAAELGDGDVDEVLKGISQVADTIEKQIPRLSEETPAVADHIGGAQQIYAVGRGASIASAFATGLLLKEAAKRNCEGSGSAQFRHGAVEVISTETAVIVFTGDQPGVRTLDDNLVGELRSYGAPVVVVGPEDGEGVRGDRFVGLPPTPAALRPILEVLPMQLLSAELAARNGVVPGEFRNTVPVIVTA
ncbi:MAG: Glucosamine-6-phosphate deaminase, alternative [Marmoricola sp.]|nr:Glucosamine-6-phosphate deaminase, alternative [Marmoricola sp.]MCW2838211.1 Glucosamine-6-phosphate deaminase, alternative [Marmoricola sp.]